MSLFPTPSQIDLAYRQILKSIKPSINTNDENSDFIIRGRVFTGIVSGLYGDQQKVNNDTWVTSARPEGLLNHGADLNIPPQSATPAECPQVRITGTNGTIINPGDLTFIYPATNVLYINTSGGTISGGFLDLVVLCEIDGQVGNIATPDSLTVVSPPTGVNAIAPLQQSMADGSDPETTDSYRKRLLARKQTPPAGGNQTDYVTFAFAGDKSVRSAFIRRFGRGLGTVDVYITTGTTDIDTAVTNGLSIVRIPSSLVLANVQAYLDSHVPETDCAAVYAPTEQTFPVGVEVILAAGLTLSSVPADAINNPLGLTVGQLIDREVGRPIYKLPVGGRILPGGTVGYVCASDIEENLDIWLSAAKDPVTGAFIGKIPILADRQCLPLDSPNVNAVVNANGLPKPGVVTKTVGFT
jgi:uncharacterized phage protein gp47/JayE